MQVNLLRAALAERNMTQGKLAELMGISPNSLSRKLKGKRQFTLKEAGDIAHILHLQNPEVIFFTQQSQIRNEEET